MKKMVLVGAVLAIFGLVLLLVFRPQWIGRGGTDPLAGDQPPDPELLETMRTALAETENLNPDAAEPLWLEALSKRPGNRDALQNLIVTRISRLNQLRAQLNDAVVDPAEKQAINETFPAYEQDAREAINDLRELAQQDTDGQRLVAAEWFAGRLDSIGTSANMSAETRESLNQTIRNASQALLTNPDAVPLVGLIDELTQLASDPIEGLRKEEAVAMLPALEAAVSANSRNLYVVGTALTFALIAEDPKASEYAMLLQELSQPMLELIRKDAGGLDLSTFGKQIADLVNDGQWQRAQGLQRPWMNLLRGTEMMKVDRRRANPNVLDFVSTSSIHNLARQVAKENELTTANTPLVFSEPLVLDSGLSTAVAMTQVEFDLLGQPEIAIASDNQVVILQKSGNEWIKVAAREVNPGIKGILQADLFPADASDPLRIKRPTSAATDPDVASESQLADLARSHDVYPELILWGENGVQFIRLDGRPETNADSRLLDSPRKSGLEELKKVVAVQSADIDADGDLDLVVSSQESGISIWINRGDLTFFSVSEFSTLPASEDPVVAMAIGDLDRDLDIDIVTMQQSGQLGWLENLLHLQMRFAPLDGGISVGEGPDNGAGVAVLEWDGNVSWDIAYSGTSTLALLTTETTGIGMMQTLENQAVSLAESNSSDETTNRVGGRLRVADLDNDSWPDLVTFGGDRLSVLRGGAARLDALTTTSLLDAAVSDVVAADFDGDGKIDLAIISEDQAKLLQNVSDVGHYINVQMKGIDDNATGRVNHFAIGSTLELRFGPHYRSQIITDRTTHFGLGELDAADNLRAVLTNGITQNIIDPPIDSTIVEQQTLKGSCPYLYTWDGEKFVFVTDCLWAAPLGLQYAVGKVIPDRPWEYLKVDGSFLEPKDGRYHLRLTEELWELAYFDHVSLIAVDHPEDVDIWTNEKVGPPESVEPKIYTVKESVPVAKATSSQGMDCTEFLRNVDEQYVQGFEYRFRQGLCPEHWVELELGAINAEDRVLLLMTGWILPTDTSLNIQIDQNPDLPGVQPPSVWIPEGDDQWVCSIPAMGFPGGKTKTIVVDLTDKLNLDDPRIRIQTNAQIYWDAAKVAINPPQAEVRTIPLDMISAEVVYRGFSEQLPRTDTQPHRYDYHDVSVNPKWPPLAGMLTRYGDCLSLLSKWDDSMVVIAGGDEIRIEFEQPSVNVPEGWKRDFILHSVGWDKDADLNTLEGQNAGPLPFKAMQAYPPPSTQWEELQQVERQNSWHRNRSQSFRQFWQR